MGLSGGFVGVGPPGEFTGVGPPGGSARWVRRMGPS